MADNASDAAVSEPVVQDTTPTDSAPVENNAPEQADPINWDEDDSQPKTETKSEPKQEETSEVETEADSDVTTADSEETPAEEQPQGKAEERKQQLNTEIRDLVTTRNELRRQVEELNTQAYAPQSAEDLMGQINPETGEYFNPLEARLAAMEQQQALERYNNQVAESQLVMENESRKALNDFPIFNPDSPQYKPELAAEAAQVLEKTLVFDQNTGLPIRSSVPIYSLYSTIAKAAQVSAVEGQMKGQQAVEKMIASSDSVGNAAPPAKSKDPSDPMSIWEDDSI